MSKDKTPAILEAVAGLPFRQRGLVLGIIKILNEPKRYPNAPKEFRDALKAARTPAAEASKQLFDSAKYFVTRTGLYVWPEFGDRILSAYKEPIARRGIKGVDHIDLRHNMYDRDIVAEYLGSEEGARKHAFTPDQVADLIDAQWGGTTGVLLNDGRANILYILGVNGVLFPVCVNWCSAHAEWDVGAYSFGDDRWRAGRRVLRNKR